MTTNPVASSFDRLIKRKRAESEVIRRAFDTATARRQTAQTNGPKET